jgi:hypothetical protein
MDQLAGLPNGRQVIFPFSAHVIPSSMATAECAFRVMNAFLDDPGAPLDTGCLDEMPPIVYLSSLPGRGND